MLIKGLRSTLQAQSLLRAAQYNSFHTSPITLEIQKMTKLRVVDNSTLGKQAMAEGKPPKCIHVYNKTGIGKIGIYYTLILSF